jgi:hypothetical protein
MPARQVATRSESFSALSHTVRRNCAGSAKAIHRLMVTMVTDGEGERIGNCFTRTLENYEPGTADPHGARFS